MSTVLFFLVGIALWPALEYGLHSGLGHLFLRGKTGFSRQHLRHHAEKDWFAPTHQKIAAAIPVTLAIFGLLWLMTSTANAAAFSIGFVVMYTFYEVTHRNAHVKGPTGPYSRWVRRNHFSHHFQNPRKNHGVTTPFFDYIFGTHVEPGKVVVPERFAMRWLIDPDTGDVWEHLSEDYELKKAKNLARKTQQDIASDKAAAYAGEAPEL